MKRMEYRCVLVPAQGEIDWDRIESAELNETVDGSPSRLRTVVKMCRSPEYVHIRFECEDDHIVATYENRDDPIYKEDVVEVFLDEEGNGTSYREYEVSPRGVIFDAWITKKPEERPAVDVSWNDDGMRAAVTRSASGTLIYDIAFANETFDKPPVPGASWNMNFYRIDDDPQGKRHYSAWSPTGRIDFHRPDKFGTVQFV
ncbi:carbohydrate-binding family 9-like protein [Paenibacillus ginsengarvi]|uniref:Carbohydrate-binding domain-containing protein n=1 Tax=Paenibacillus ginsengarvi TaxID=400777 RepID=A0A3B0BE82_9BACL|nr:carbohydrate-binding family 9-like protein [Paenibacillus ginsengarvi]RKN70634.1 hypothetical protein D7M11_29770 [Paenibacillus ginsengarvi]